MLNCQFDLSGHFGGTGHADLQDQHLIQKRNAGGSQLSVNAKAPSAVKRSTIDQVYPQENFTSVCSCLGWGLIQRPNS